MTNPLQAELLDLITLMPDAQVDELLAYVAALRAARGLATAPLVQQGRHACRLCGGQLGEPRRGADAE